MTFPENNEFTHQTLSKTDIRDIIKYRFYLLPPET